MKRFVLVLAFAVSLLPGTLFSQGGVKVKITATGTGNTTGHIANLTVHNMEKNNIRINSQTAYIPSDGRYQSYVGTVPETTVPPGTTIIPVNGNCANVSSPPFPIGIDMTVEKWIPVGTIGQPPPEGTINILPMPTKPQFTPDDIPGLIKSSGYTMIADLPKGDSEIIINWPGTDIPVGGVIDPDKYPEDFAPVIVEVLADIIDAVDTILKDDQYDTPFSGNPEKEKESVIQQTFWIYMAAATGDEYTQDDFEGKVYDQFLTSSGKPVASLPEEQKKEIDNGIGDFWNVFTAVGVEAKILAKPEGTTSKSTTSDPDQSSDPPVLIKEEKKEKQCQCGNISFELQVWDTKEDPPNNWTGIQDNLFRKNIDEQSKPDMPDVEIKAGKKGLKKGSVQLIVLKNIMADCPCVEITDAIKDAIEELEDLVKDTKSKLSKAKKELEKAEAKLEKEKDKRKPDQNKIKDLEEKVTEARNKVAALEKPITDKQAEIEDLKTKAKLSDCPVHDNADEIEGTPNITVKEGNNVISGKWYKDDKSPDDENFKFTLTKGDKPMEFRIELSYNCGDEDCKPVQCSRSFVIKVDE